MDPFERRRLGRSELRVTRLGLGTGPLGGARVRVSEADAVETVAAAVDSGINYFDTAPWYGVGQAEMHLGRGLADRLCPDHVVSTKVGRLLFPATDPAHPPFAARWPGGAPNDVHFDYTRAGVLRSHEESLKRLGLRRVDALVIHDLDLKFHRDDAGVDARFGELERGGGFAALNEMKAAGVTRAVGAGINHPGLIPRFLDSCDLDFFLVAMPYTLMDQSILESEMPQCLKRGVSLVIGAPFCSGLLAPVPRTDAWYGYRPAEPETLARVRALEEVCQRHNVELAAAALQFPLAHPAVAAVIPGPECAAHVHGNVELLRQPISSGFWAELKARALLHPEAPTP